MLKDLKQKIGTTLRLHVHLNKKCYSHFTSTCIRQQTTFGSSPPLHVLLHRPPPPTHPLCPPTTYTGHHYLSHLKRAKYMYKPYALVRGSTQKCLQLIHLDEQKEGRKKGVKMYIFVPVCYKSFNASCILKLKICTSLLNLQSGPILAALLFPVTVCGCSMFSKQNGWERWEEAVYKAIQAGTPQPYFHTYQLEKMVYIYIYIYIYYYGTCHAGHWAKREFEWLDITQQQQKVNW